MTRRLPVDRLGLPAVKREEVLDVDAVLHDLLRMRSDAPLAFSPQVVAGVGKLLDDVGRPVGLLSFGVMPDEHETVVLPDPTRSDHGFGRQLVGVRDRRAASRVAAVAPAVERTPDRLAFDSSADAEMRTEVRAVRIDGECLPAGSAEHDHLYAERLHGFDLADLELVGVADGEPSVRIRGKWDSLHRILRW